MVTVDLSDLMLNPQSVVLDAGCGSGRHLRALAQLPGVNIIGVDTNRSDLDAAMEAMKNMPGNESDNYLIIRGDIGCLPFDPATFDCVICSEVLEHIPDHEKAIRELVRVLKPDGKLVVSVPRYFSEKICWLISTAYHSNEGGHIRIYKKKELHKILKEHGFKCWKINYKHALHAPYWWLKCLVGIKNEHNFFIRCYKKFLEWDIMSKPRLIRVLEEILNPIIGKSIVFYLRKG